MEWVLTLGAIVTLFATLCLQYRRRPVLSEPLGAAWTDEDEDDTYEGMYEADITLADVG